MAVSIRDVARACGVSTYTVSSVINEKGRVSDATRAQVMEVVRELGYEPSENIPHTRRNKIRRLGLVLPFGETPNATFYMRALTRAKKATNRQRIELSVYSHAEIKHMLTEDFHLGRSQVDCGGMIFFAPKGDWQQYARTLLKWDIKVAVIRRRSQIPGVYHVYDDDYGGMRKLTLHLLQRGHRNIAVVGGMGAGWMARERIRGYQDALSEYNIEYDESLILNLGGPRQKKLRSMRECLGNDIVEQRKGDRPATAIVCFNDAMVGHAVSSLIKAGLRVPEDIAVAGYGDEPIAAQMVPSITSINIPVEEMMEHAVDCLTKPQEKAIKGFTFDNDLIVRESTPPLA